jgi:hypothetical protein
MEQKGCRMSRIYTVPANGTLAAASGDYDLLALRPAADKPIALRGLRLGQAGTADFGDAQEEGLRITIRRFTATVTDGTGGTAPTPVPVDDVDAAAGFTARVLDTAVATTTGTNELKEEVPWNVRNVPCEYWWPDPDFAPKCRLNANRLIVRLESAVADDITTFVLTAWVEEQ